jgi:hypothetical protein
MTAHPIDWSTFRPRRRDGLVTELFDDELVVYDPSVPALHLLNATATMVWQECDGERTVEAIATVLASASSTDREVVLSDVIGLVADLASSSLLECGSVPDGRSA